MTQPSSPSSRGGFYEEIQDNRSEPVRVEIVRTEEFDLAGAERSRKCERRAAICCGIVAVVAIAIFATLKFAR